MTVKKADGDSPRPARSGEDRDDRPSRARRDGEEDAVEIVDVTAADDAGVPLEAAESGADLEVLGHDAQQAHLAAAARVEALERELAEARGRASAAEERSAAAEARGHELREQLLRTAADLDNFRKRMERERVEERRQAAAGLIKNLLPATDNLRRALEQASRAAAESPALAAFTEGVRMIEQQLHDILGAAGLERVDASGAFDPSVHEALMQEPRPDIPHMAVLEVLEPGYRLGGRLLRPARVKVCWNPDAVPAPAVEADGTAGDGEST